MKISSLKPLALSLLLLSSMPALAAKTWKINLKDADIGALVTEMSEITGRNFVLDPRVKGTVTVVSSKALSADQLYELFQSVLSINGFAAVPSGAVVKIMPDTNARQAGVGVDVRDGRGPDRMVTRVILLQQANANELLNALRPMVPQSANLAAVPGVNALVMTDRAGNADAMESIVRQLDTGGQDDAIEVIPLVNSKADDLINIIETVEGGATGSSAPGGQAHSGRVRVIADSRSNELIIRGDKMLRDRVRELVHKLDQAPEGGNDVVRVFRLKFANARQVAEVLKGIIAGANDKVGSTTTLQGAQGMSASSSGFGSSGMGSSSMSGMSTGSSMGMGVGMGSSTGQSNGGATTTIMVGTSSLIADETQNALIVRARPRQIQQIESVLGDLDRRRAQVLIQAAIVEVSGDNAQQLGVQWAFGSLTSGVGVVNFSNAGASLANIGAAALTGDVTQANIADGATVALGAYKTSANGNPSFYGALVEALHSVSEANLLSTPSIMTLDNQEAKIVVGQNVPFITGSTATVSAGVSNPFTTIQRQDVGITLRVTPTLSDGDTVKLDIQQDVSSLVPSSSTTVKASDIITNTRSIKTSVLADNGQTIVLGGLVQDDVTKSVNKVPVLGDLPWIGGLFRSTSESRTKSNLLVFLQPTIVRDASQANQLTKRQYDAVRGVDLGLDAEGHLTRLPANIQDIYQGGKQREGADPGSTAVPMAEKYTGLPAALPASQPVAAPTPAPAPKPAPVPVVKPAPAVVVTQQAPAVAPQVYSAPIDEESMPIVATPLPAQTSSSAASRPAVISASPAPRQTSSSGAAATAAPGKLRVIRTSSGHTYYVRDLPTSP